jgi:hypothetical protein
MPICAFKNRPYGIIWKPVTLLLGPFGGLCEQSIDIAIVVRSPNFQESQSLLSGCTNSCRAVNPARCDLLQPRFEGSRQRFADEQARAAAAAKRKPRFFGGGREWPAAGESTKPCCFGCRRERDTAAMEISFSLIDWRKYWRRCLSASYHKRERNEREERFYLKDRLSLLVRSFPLFSFVASFVLWPSGALHRP